MAMAHGDNICYWCGTEGWLRRCNRCGFWTCDTCWRPHRADTYKQGQRRYPSREMVQAVTKERERQEKEPRDMSMSDMLQTTWGGCTAEAVKEKGGEVIYWCDLPKGHKGPHVDVMESQPWTGKPVGKVQQ